MINGRRQPSHDGTSRMNREVQVRFCEGLGVKFPGPTRQPRPSADRRYVSFNRKPTFRVMGARQVPRPERMTNCPDPAGRTAWS